jgi:hypothetical protein
MGLTNNLGRISTGLTADASLNIGVGVTPSGTYKFEVGTTSKFTGVATFGSTISNGTYTYTLPSATGTLALTSALSGYLPLSGGTLTGALGGTSATFSGNVAVGQGSTGAVNIGGTTPSINAASFLRLQGSNTAQNYEISVNQYVANSISITPSTSLGGTTYTTPILTMSSATGLSVTGAATFSSSVTATNSLTINSTTNPIVFLNSTGTNQANGTVLQESGTNKWAIGSNLGSADGSFNIYNYGASARYLSIASTGAATFTGALGGTSATFSGAMRSNGVEITNTANADILDIFQSPSALNSFIDYPSSRSLIIRNKGSLGGLTLASTGAATFTNNLTLSNANSTTDLGGVLIVRGNGSIHSTHYLTTGAVNVAAYYQYDAAGVVKNVIHAGGNSYITGGNFGIGTSSPGYKLDVLGSASDWAAHYKSSAGSQPDVYLADGSGNGGIFVNTRNTTSTNNALLLSNGTNFLFTVNNAGTVTINTLGTGVVYSLAGALTSTNPSDSSLKNSISPLSYGLTEILKLQPKKFYYNSDTAKASLKYGFIAQDVQLIMPDIVRTLGNGSDKLGLESDGIYVTMVNAIQELSAKNEALIKRIETLENK